MNPRFSDETEADLRRAGWYPGRKTDVEAWRPHLEASGFVFPDVVVRFLEEFNGLSFPYRGSGITRAKEAVEFDPFLAVGEENRFAQVGAGIGRVLAPIGELDNRWFLGMDDTGGIHFVGAVAELFGVGDAGLESLLAGIMPVKIEPRLR